jgi:uncharacterized protein YbaR (Trm112 family)
VRKPDDVSLIQPRTEGDEVVQLWQGAPRLAEATAPGPPREAFYQETRSSAARHLARRLMVAAGSVLHAVFSAHLRPDIVSLVRCLDCASRVARESAETLTCTGCGRKYPLRNGIPIMLNEEPAQP